MTCLGFNYLYAVLLCLSDSQINLFVEASRTEDRRVKQIRPICCANNEDLIGRCCIHLLKELCNNSIHHLVRVATVSSLGHQCVKLVHKNNTWTAGPCSLEHCTNIFLTLAHIHIEQLWPFYAYEVHFTLFSDTLPQEGFASPRWAIEQQSCSGFNPLVKDLRVLDGKEHSLHNLFFGCLQSSNVIPAHFYQILYLLLLYQFSQLLKHFAFLLVSNVFP